jgi:hypothetical protein
MIVDMTSATATYAPSPSTPPTLSRTPPAPTPDVPPGERSSFIGASHTTITTRSLDWSLSLMSFTRAYRYTAAEDVFSTGIIALCMLARSPTPLACFGVEFESLSSPSPLGITVAVNVAHSDRACAAVAHELVVAMCEWYTTTLSHELQALVTFARLDSGVSSATPPAERVRAIGVQLPYLIGIVMLHMCLHPQHTELSILPQSRTPAYVAAVADLSARVRRVSSAARVDLLRRRLRDCIAQTLASPVEFTTSRQEAYVAPLHASWRGASRARIDAELAPAAADAALAMIADMTHPQRTERRSMLDVLRTHNVAVFESLCVDAAAFASMESRAQRSIIQVGRAEWRADGQPPVVVSPRTPQTPTELAMRALTNN